MPRAWTCIDNPSHGAFLQDGIIALQEAFEDFQRGARAGRSRLCCPVCASIGLPGFVRPASTTEAARIAA